MASGSVSKRGQYEYELGKFDGKQGTVLDAVDKWSSSVLKAQLAALEGCYLSAQGHRDRYLA